MNPDPTLAVTENCPKHGVHLSQPAGSITVSNDCSRLMTFKFVNSSDLTKIKNE